MPYAIVIIIIAIVVIGCIYAFISTNKIKKDGIEVEGEVSRIDIETKEEIDDETGTITNDTSKSYFVTYTNESGEVIEASLINPKLGLKEGDKIKIKYLPSKPKNVLRVK